MFSNELWLVYAKAIEFYIVYSQSFNLSSIGTNSFSVG